jgi:threonine dehydrogenase-like Zn-dependent dehydrogenase
VSARIGPLCAVGVLDGKIEPGRVFDRSVPLDETPDGYRAMDQREALKVMIEP